MYRSPQGSRGTFARTKWDVDDVGVVLSRCSYQLVTGATERPSFQISVQRFAFQELVSSSSTSLQYKHFTELFTGT